MISGSLWMIAMRWSIKLLALVNTFFLIRFLAPEDFGLVAKAIVILGLVEIIMDSGAKQSLVQMENPQSQHYDAVFTLNTGLGIIIFCILCAISPLAASFMHEEQLKILLPILATRAIFMGLNSPKTVDFFRNFEFKKDFWSNVLGKFVTVPITIILAFIFQNYWALIGGQVAGQFVALILSYIFAPYKPKLNFSYIKDIWAFSVQFVFMNYAIFLLQRLDEILLAKFSDTKSLGYYNVASETGMLFTGEIVYPLTRSFFSIFANLQKQKEALLARYKQTFSISWHLTLSMTAGVFIIAPDLILLIGGKKWQAATPFLQFLVIAASCHIFSLVNLTILQATGHQKAASYLMWCNLLLLFITLPYTAIYYQALDVAMVRMYTLLCFIPMNIYVVLKLINMPFSRIMWHIINPLIATSIMIIILLTIHDFIADLHLSLRLAISILSGIVAYSTTTLLLWYTTGKQDGLERFILEQINKKLKL